MDNRIDRFKMSDMRNKLHYEYHKGVVSIVDIRDAALLAELELATWLPPYFAAFEREKKALEIITWSNYTGLMAEKDRDRDNDYRGFRGTVKQLLLHTDAGVRQAATRVMALFKHYGNVSKKPYDEASAAVEDFLGRLDEDELAADLQTLQLTGWRDRLKADNDAFRTLRKQRVSEKAAKTTARMNKTRKEVDLHYRNIILHFEYMVRAGKTSPALDGIIARLNALVKSYRDVLAHTPVKPHRPKASPTDNLAKKQDAEDIQPSSNA